MTGAWFDAVVRASWQGALLVAAVWIVRVAWRGLSPSVRALLWLLAAAKFLLVLCFVLEVPVLPASEMAAGGAGSVSGSAYDWKPALMALWALGTVVIVGRAVIQARWLHRLTREADPADERLVALWNRVGGGDGIEVRVHADAPVPMVVGSRRPVIVVPASLVPQLDDEELLMILAHENAHVRRRDALASLPLFTCFALFYFHPFVWLLQREWRHDREAACDADAMAALGTAPRRYAQMLLKVSTSAQSMPRLALSAAPSFRTLQRRINDMKNPINPRRGHIAWTLLVMVFAAAATPFILVKREVSIVSEGQVSPAPLSEAQTRPLTVPSSPAAGVSTRPIPLQPSETPLAGLRKPGTLGQTFSPNTRAPLPAKAGTATTVAPRPGKRGQASSTAAAHSAPGATAPSAAAAAPSEPGTTAAVPSTAPATPASGFVDTRPPTVQPGVAGAETIPPTTAAPRPNTRPGQAAPLSPNASPIPAVAGPAAAPAALIPPSTSAPGTPAPNATTKPAETMPVPPKKKG